MDSMIKPDQNQTPSSDNDPIYANESSFMIFVKLFIIPALIVFAVLGLFILIAVELQHPQTPQSYLRALETEDNNNKWQAAFNLSRLLDQEPQAFMNPVFQNQIVQAFQNAGQDDPRVRSYLALVLGRLKDKAAVPTLIHGVKDPKGSVRFYCLWALGNIGDPAAGSAVLRQAQSKDLEIRELALGVLSSMRYRPAEKIFISDLKSFKPSIRYNAAVGLARLKNPQSIPVLMKMLKLNPNSHFSNSLIQSAQLAAIQGALEFPNNAGLHNELVQLSHSAINLKVREAALKALKVHS
jgi:HEAT repeat protein